MPYQQKQKTKSIKEVLPIKSMQKSKAKFMSEFAIETKNAETIRNSIRIEGETKSKAKLYLAKDGLLLRIEAEDLTALRAAINAWLRLIRMCEEVIKVIEIERC